MKGFDPDLLAEEEIPPAPAPQLDPLYNTEPARSAEITPKAREPALEPEVAPETVSDPLPEQVPEQTPDHTQTSQQEDVQTTDPAARSKALATALIALSVRPGIARLDPVFVLYQDAGAGELSQAATAITAVVLRAPVEQRVDLVEVLKGALSAFSGFTLAHALKAQLGAVVMTGPEPPDAPPPPTPPDSGDGE